MDILALAVPLPAVFGLTNLCGSAFARSPCFALDAGACLLPLLAGDLGLHLVVFTHGSGFPFADATSHELWAVGFPDVDPLYEEVEHTHVPSVVIHLKLSALESREQAGADVPAPLKLKIGGV